MEGGCRRWYEDLRRDVIVDCGMAHNWTARIGGIPTEFLYSLGNSSLNRHPKFTLSFIWPTCFTFQRSFPPHRKIAAGQKRCQHGQIS